MSLSELKTAAKKLREMERRQADLLGIEPTILMLKGEDLDAARKLLADPLADPDAANSQ